MIVECPTCQHEHSIKSLEKAELFYNKVHSLPVIYCAVHPFHPLSTTKHSDLINPDRLVVASCTICLNEAVIVAVGQENDRRFGW